MAWSGLTLTNAGQDVLKQAQLSNKMAFKSIVIGDGIVSQEFSSVEGLAHQLYEITDIKIDITENGCNLTADFPNVDYDYFFREIGVIVSTETGDKLYVYDNCGSDAQHIVNSGNLAHQKRIRLSLVISGVAEITILEPALLYVTYEDFKQALDKKVDKEAISEITVAELEAWYAELSSDTGISNEEIRHMYMETVDYGEDTGINNEEIERMYLETVDYGEDRGISNEEIRAMYF